MGSRMVGHVVVRCVQCQAEKSIGPGEVPAGDIPMCSKCMAPMIAVEAVAQEVRDDGV
jgi:hypothetical protein